MRYTIQQRMRSGEFRWAILKEGKEVASIASYLSAFRIVNTLNENAELTPIKVAAVEIVSKESVRVDHLKRVLTAKRNAEMRI